MAAIVVVVVNNHAVGENRAAAVAAVADGLAEVVEIEDDELQIIGSTAAPGAGLPFIDLTSSSPEPDDNDAAAAAAAAAASSGGGKKRKATQPLLRNPIDADEGDIEEVDAAAATLDALVAAKAGAKSQVEVEAARTGVSTALKNMLTCPVCLSAPMESMSVTDCGHVYCKLCIGEDFRYYIPLTAVTCRMLRAATRSTLLTSSNEVLSGYLLWRG